VGPVDPRLLRLPRLRWYLLAMGGSAALTALLVIAQASALATLIATAVDGRLDRPALIVALAVFAARAVQHWLTGLLAGHTAAAVKADLRDQVLAAAARRGPGWLAGQRAGSVITLVGRGVDALDGYLVGYLPQLLLGVTVPIAVLARIAWADPTSAVVVGITLPLIPIFAILVGWQTKARTDKQWRLLSTLGGHFLDMLSGMSTLRSFGRAGAQVQVVRGMADRYRSATMATLRIAFLSALVLELISSISVALVAVPIGLRLLDGKLTLSVALLVLLLAPEAYTPLRTAGARFHASQEGLAAATEVFAVLEEEGQDRDLNPEGAPAGHFRVADRDLAAATPGVPDPARDEIVFEDVAVRGLRGVSFTLRPGERIAFIGPSGGGKSTILEVLLGFVPVESGRVLVGGVDLSTIDLDAWRRRLAWVPQRPHLFADTVAANIALGAPGTPAARIEAAARAAYAHEFVTGLPDGYATRLGEGGTGLSTGQRQRLALARAFLRTEAADGAGAGLVLLDEPTAGLDGASEAAVLAASGTLVSGRGALVVAHRPALLAGADRVLRVRDGAVSEVVPV
jgi:ATP-binding cassette, subfamily C, bacterial CydD